MTMHHLLIKLTAKTRKLNIPPELEAWLLSEYGWEPAEGIWDPAELMDIIEAHCDRYWDENSTSRFPMKLLYWKDRAETTAYILQGIILEKIIFLQNAAAL